MQHRVDEIVAATPGVSWSIAIRGTHEAAHDPDRRLRTASVGKLLLLMETARRITAGELDPAERLVRRDDQRVADSGLWQHLTTDALPIGDLAVLIAAVSDNYATNVLLDRIGLASVAAHAEKLGLRHTALHDRVRDDRGPQHPPTLSTGSAGELCALMRRIPEEYPLVERWMATSTDLSMVAAALDEDPLAHTDGVRNKTGTDAGVRADVGFFGDVAYAVIANWDPAAGDATTAVMAAMNGLLRA